MWLSVGALVWGLAPGSPSWAERAPQAVGAVPAGVWGPSHPVRLRPQNRQGERIQPDALATSTRRGTTLLHVVTVASDAYPFTRGVVSYGRSTRNGSTWSQRLRISPPSHVASNAIVSAAGRWVYVAWIRSNSPRRCASRPTSSIPNGCTLYVRVNDDYGRSTAWSPVRRLSPRSAGVFSPGVSIAATRSSVFIAGATKGHATLWASRDHGAHWASRRLGSSGEILGPTAVAAHDSLVVLAWTRTDFSPSAWARVSRDGGRHWSAAHAAGVVYGHVSSAAALDGRVVIAGGTDGHFGLACSWVQEWRHGTWRPVLNVLPRGEFPYAEAVQLRGDHGIGLAYAAQLPSAEVGGILLGVVWQTSSDGGRTWTDGFEVERTQMLPAPPLNGRPWLSLAAVWRPTGAVHVLSSLTVEYPRYEVSTMLRSRT